MLRFSESCGKVVAALLAVQREIQPVAKDRTNTFFNSKYATLDAIIDYVRPILARHELVLLQGPSELGDVGVLSLETRLVHLTGEWVANVVWAPVVEEIGKDGKQRQANSQTVGKTITYLRRFGLSTLLAITTDEDTDGNGRQETVQRRESKKAPRTIVQDVNAAKATTVAQIPFPAVSGYEAHRGVALGLVPTEALEACYVRAVKRSEKKAKMIADAIAEVLEERRSRSDFTAPHPALSSTSGELPLGVST